MNLKITIKCNNCKILSNFDDLNLINLAYEFIDYSLITRVYNDLICKNCRHKNPILLRDEKHTVIGLSKEICVNVHCNKPIVTPRLIAFQEDKHLLTCICCAKGEVVSTNHIYNNNYKNERIIKLKELKKICSKINNIEEYKVCKNDQLRKIANLEYNFKSNLDKILDRNSFFYLNFKNKILKILSDISYITDINLEESLIYFG